MERADRQRLQSPKKVPRQGDGIRHGCGRHQRSNRTKKNAYRDADENAAKRTRLQMVR